MKSVLTQKIYTYVWDKDRSKEAEIIFKLRDGKLEFKECLFRGVESFCTISIPTNTIRSIGDWDFLGDLAAEIKRLCEGRND